MLVWLPRPFKKLSMKDFLTKFLKSRIESLILISIIYISIFYKSFQNGSSSIFKRWSLREDSEKSNSRNCNEHSSHHYGKYNNVSEGLYSLPIKKKCTAFCRTVGMRSMPGKHQSHESRHILDQWWDWTESPGLTWASHKRFYVKENIK